MLQFSQDFLSIKYFAAQQQPSLIWHVPALEIFPCITLVILSAEQNVKQNVYNANTPVYCC